VKEARELSTDVEAAAPGLFVPDLLLASQYFDRVRARQDYDPERRLMIAVLERAVDDYRTCRSSRDAKRQVLFREVTAWFASRESSGLYSFENVCEVLDLNADYVRRGLHGGDDHRTDPPPADAPEAEALRLASGA
jgi:hypothetical protein